MGHHMAAIHYLVKLIGDERLRLRATPTYLKLASDRPEYVRNLYSLEQLSKVPRVWITSCICEDAGINNLANLTTYSHYVGQAIDSIGRFLISSASHCTIQGAADTVKADCLWEIVKCHPSG
jgi:hypothetical protein